LGTGRKEMRRRRILETNKPEEMGKGEDKPAHIPPI
jgi:hypothetical protein